MKTAQGVTHPSYFKVAALEDLDIKYAVEYVTLSAAANVAAPEFRWLPPFLEPFFRTTPGNNANHPGGYA